MDYSIWGLLSREDLQHKKVLKRLVTHHTWLSSDQIIVSYDMVLDTQTYERVVHDYDRFAKDKEPLEYILWYVEFDNRQWYVDTRTLIPRPETEYMIQALYERYDAQNSEEKLTIVDVGAWCGVLGISLLFYAYQSVSNAYSLDLSPDCLDVVLVNVNKHMQLRWQTLQYRDCREHTDNADIVPEAATPFLYVEQSDLLGALLSDRFPVTSSVVIVANLPYIPQKVFDHHVEENVKRWEPVMAFVAGEDGLIYYRQMFAQLDSLRQRGVQKVTMFLEMMTWQAEILQEEYGDRLILEQVKTFHFQIRIVKVTREYHA